MTLLNALDPPEDSITATNYEEAFIHLNNSSPDIIRGLDIKVCDMQELLSEVNMYINDYLSDLQVNIVFQSYQRGN